MLPSMEMTMNKTSCFAAEKLGHHAKLLLADS